MRFLINPKCRQYSLEACMEMKKKQEIEEVNIMWLITAAHCLNMLSSIAHTHTQSTVIEKLEHVLGTTYQIGILGSVEPNVMRQCIKCCCHWQWQPFNEHIIEHIRCNEKRILGTHSYEYFDNANITKRKSMPHTQFTKSWISKCKVQHRNRI